MLTGFGKLEQVMAETASRSALAGASLTYFKLKPGEKKIVRFLTDDVITVDVAERVKCFNGKFQSFIIEPNNNLLARYAPPEAWDGSTKKKTIAVAVIRKEQLAPSIDPAAAPRTEVVDYEETRSDGLRGRQYVLIMQGHQNFWDQLVGFNSIYHTICDRDYAMMRIGENLDTKYRIAPMDPRADDPLRDVQVAQQFYGYGRAWNKDDPERFLYCPQTLPEWYAKYTGEERVRHWMLGEGGQAAITPPAAAGSGAGTFNTPAVDPVLGGMPQQDFSTLRSRLGGHAVAEQDDAPPF